MTRSIWKYPCPKPGDTNIYTDMYLGDVVLFTTHERAAAVANREMKEDRSVIYIVTIASLTVKVLS